MAVKNRGISPDLLIHPGETISDVLEERGITQKELAQRAARRFDQQRKVRVPVLRHQQEGRCTGRHKTHGHTDRRLQRQPSRLGDPGGIDQVPERSKQQARLVEGPHGRRQCRKHN